MCHMLLICFSWRLFICMMFQTLLFLIGMLNLYIIFGELCDLNWGQIYCFLLYVSHGQTEVANHKLYSTLRVILKTNLKLWEVCLPHIQFAYNRSVHSTLKVSPFQVVYDFNPHAPIELLYLTPSKTTCFDASQ
jgi:hypothetical protein